MAETNSAYNTALHDSCTVCAWCRRLFVPRIRHGPNAARFCEPAHKDKWWSRQRRKNPPSVDAVATGEESSVTAGAKKNPRHVIRVRHNGHVLLLSRHEFAVGLARASRAAAAIPTLDPATHLTVKQVLAAMNLCRSRLYQLIGAGRFPRATIVYGPLRGQHVACWRAADVAAWQHGRKWHVAD